MSVAFSTVSLYFNYFITNIINTIIIHHHRLPLHFTHGFIVTNLNSANYHQDQLSTCLTVTTTTFPLVFTLLLTKKKYYTTSLLTLSLAFSLLNHTLANYFLANHTLSNYFLANHTIANCFLANSAKA